MIWFYPRSGRKEIALAVKRAARAGRKSVLVVAAHPDDEVLGCGGTLASLAASDKGVAIHVGILGEGISSRYARREQAPRAALARLKTQARAANAAWGAKSVEFGGLPDNRFDGLPLLQIVKQVERWIEAWQPEVIYTHHPGDLNIDHSLTFRAVLTATRPMAGTPVKELVAFEVPSSTEWAFQRVEPPFRPNVFVDISKTIEVKVKALQRYEEEVRAFPHPRSPEALRTLARTRGSAVGVPYAEAFELIRSIR